MKIEFSKEANLPTRFGNFKIKAVREYQNDVILEHLVAFSENLSENLGENINENLSQNLAKDSNKKDSNKPKNHPKIPLVRVHSECLTGDVFGSRKCDCGPELTLAMERIYDEGGMLIYLRQEGRGIGLFNKINAYNLQDNGLDTVQANEALGFKNDERHYDIVGEIFRHFGINEIKLLTNNPKKIEEMQKYVKCTRSSIIIQPNEYNKNYLQVKKSKLGHLL